MADVLIASDSPELRASVRSVLDHAKDQVREVESGPEVVRAVAEALPSLVVLDFQIASMGGMATCLELRLEESGGRLEHVPVLLLLDRRADVYLAKRALADGWLIKPLDPIRLRRAIKALLSGQPFHDESFKPVTV
ncbi:MAG: two-component system response regulator [Acidimicrobiia bacterium]